jgi:hypothetical protein
MALIVADRVQELTTTSGTGTLTLNGAVSGFQTFSNGIGNGNTTYYTIYDPVNYDWEVGIGTVGSGTLSRDTVLANSAGTTAKITLAGNSASVFCTYPADKSVNYNAAGVLEVGDSISYSDTGIVATFASTVAGYNQLIFQNKSTSTSASANINVSNNASSATDGFAELGINSSTFSNGAGCFNIPNAAYVASAGADLSIGTYNAYDIHFATNSSTTDAMTIFDNGGTSLGGYGNPGIGNLALNKVVSGVTDITSAGGTTALTASSTYYQRVTGTTTQTIQLPDATTLLNGTTFIIDNDSTGNVTVTDNATASLDVVPAGGLSYIYLINNSTVAGTWTAHGYLPSIYNFNNTTADFGNATIINAVWNGTTIPVAYGGTGLTTFTAANNALYSTGATTLTAGTLPIAAGGTGATTLAGANIAVTNVSNTFTANQVISVTDNTNAALRITQTGTGNALVVEDDTNPDATPFVVDANGNVGVGTTTPTSFVGSGVAVVSSSSFAPSTAIVNKTNDSGAGAISLLKDRANAIVNSGDSVGFLNFRAFDGTSYVETVRITGAIDGTPGANDMPGRLVFSTTADGASTPTERMRIDSAGSVGIGATAITGYNLRIGKNMTGAVSTFGVQSNGAIQSDVTTGAFMFRTAPTTQNATFTLPTLSHYDAAQGAFGASSTVTNQYGFAANSSLTGATNNYGFFGNIASGSGRWNFYAAGTAVNYFAGNVGIGSGKTAPATALDVNGTITATALDLTTALSPADGGTGQTTYTDGQLLIGNSTGNTLTKATLTQGSGITITNGPGTITIASTGGSGGASIGLVRVISTNCIFP